MMLTTMQKYSVLIARILMSALFIMAGAQKFMSLDGTAAYIASAGIPLAMVVAVLVALLEVFGGLSVLLGCKARASAWALAIFSILAALIFHSDGTQMVMFMKNLSIAGGLMLVGVYGPGAMSMDERKKMKAAPAPSSEGQPMM